MATVINLCHSMRRSLAPQTLTRISPYEFRSAATVEVIEVIEVIVVIEVIEVIEVIKVIEVKEVIEVIKVNGRV